MYAQCRPFRGPRDKYSPVICSLDEETNGTNFKTCVYVSGPSFSLFSLTIRRDKYSPF